MPAQDRYAQDRAQRREHLKVVRRFEQLCAHSPEAHARLRRGLGKGLDEVPGMHEFVAPLMPGGLHPDQQRAYYTLAALLADRPRHAFPEPDEDEQSAGDSNGDTETEPWGQSLGMALAEAATNGRRAEQERRKDRARSRIGLLVRQSVPGVHRYLPSTVRFLRDNEVEPDWAQLLTDLRQWPWSADRIGRIWQQDYFREVNRAAWERSRKKDDTAGLG